MSKRGAQGPQGDKDTDLFSFNMSSTPDDKPQRATAAQLANRRIKDVRRRRPNSSTPSTTGASFSGPFNSLDPNTVSSPSAAPQPASGSFTFGQSQSFPGASPNPSQPTQNGGSPFSFGSGGGSSGFNFSAGAGQASLSSNPFATMSSGGNQPPSGGGQFSGFQGNLFSLPPTGTSSPAPAQQALPSGGLFGNNSQQTSTPGGLFSTPASSAPTGLSAGTPTSGNMFNFSSAASSTPQPNLFGQSSTSKPSPFSQSTAFGESMQTSPDAKNNSQSKPSLFGASAPSFGGSTNFGSPAGTGSMFGAPPGTTAETPSKPLFAASAQNSSTTPAFGAATQSTSTSTPAVASTPATAPPTSNLFASGSPDKPATPFANLFGGASTPSAAPKAPEEKTTEQKNGETAQAKSPFQFAPTSTSGSSLFSKGETSAAPASGLFQTSNAGGSGGSSSSSNLFAPKPAAQEQEKPESAANPFQSLFSPKPATPAPTSSSSTPSNEQKALPPAAPLSNPFKPPTTPAVNAQKSGPEAPAATTPLFPASTPALNGPPSSSSPQPSLFSSATAPKLQQAEMKSPAPAQSPFKPSGASSSSPPVSAPNENAPTSKLEQLQPSGLPGDLDQETKEDAGVQYRVRMLNVSFQRHIAGLDPGKDDFEKVISYYLRVRETLGVPIDERKPKRKIEDDRNGAAEGPASKKARPFSGVDAETPTKATSSSPATTTPAPTTATPSKLVSTATQNSNKRRSPDREDDDGCPEKRVNGDSTTANIFAQSFSKSKSSDSDSAQAGPATPAGASPVKAPSLFPTPSASSSSSTKPTFDSPAKSTGSSSSLFGSSASVSKPAFIAPTANSTAASNPFVPKPSGEASSGAASGPPKSSTGSANFFAQFKAQADKSAEKEKAKRKAEDFDSDEDDEAEWERQDAEKQRQKRQHLESNASKRAVFVPGKGFVFEDASASGTKDKDAEPTPPASGAGASVFNTKGKSPAGSNNIFGHLSATPSEVEEDNDADDTEEASAAGDDQDDGSKDVSFALNSDKSESNAPALSANESSDDGDSTNALQKGKQPEKTAINGPSDPSAGGRSLFDRVEKDEDGNPKRQGEGEEKLSTFFNSSKYASSFNSPASTPNPFGQPANAQTDQAAPPFSKPATPNPFGGLFNSPTNSGAPSPSIFTANNGTPKPPNDQTWKANSPIKFASGSTAPSGPKLDFTAPSSAADSSKPLSTLFGGASSGANSTAATPSNTGFSFGGPPQKPASFLAPSTFSSAAPSRTPTPGVTTDTGAEESGDSEAAESLPQVDLSRGGAGEENEDVVLELRARGMKLLPGSAGWESQGVGYVRILKDRTTSRGRILLRADPSGKVVLNASLMKQIKYTVSGNNVQFLVPQAEGAPEQWAVRVKKEEVQRLSSAIEETKS